uniref:MyTH4 domain-containing protein n=1 Tax=Xiphophorus maculatus TaxID=8083 RepID=A0A3B5R185_XIPMA
MFPKPIGLSLDRQDVITLFAHTYSWCHLYRSSCTFGWRLLSLITGFFPCSAILHPFVMQHLQEICQDNEHPYQELAFVCLDNLQRSINFGGRRNIPSHVEMEAVLVSYTFRQVDFLSTKKCFFLLDFSILPFEFSLIATRFQGNC